MNEKITSTIEWYRVDERLPDNARPVLVVTVDKLVTTGACFRDQATNHAWDIYGEPGNVLLWSEFPCSPI